MKIVVLPNLPYTYRDHLRFGVKELLEKGYMVDVLDVHHILHPGYKTSVNIEYFTFDSHYEPLTKEDLLQNVQMLDKEDLILSYLGSNAVQLMKEIKKHTDARIAMYLGGAIPLKGITFDIPEVLPQSSEEYLFEPDLLISGSPAELMINQFVKVGNAQFIRSNSRDYNLCLSVKGYQHDKQYCVYLDTDLIDASDYVLFGKSVEADISMYMEKLFRFFTWIEETYKIDVIIAAHPKSRVYQGKSMVNGFKVEHFQSAELVKNSEFVLNEGTTSVSFAVFFNKPLIFFNFQEILFFEHCFSISKELGKQIIDLDDFDETMFQQELSNKSGYKSYKLKYLTYDDTNIGTFDQLDKLIKCKLIGLGN